MLTKSPYMSIEGPKLEDDLNFLKNGRRPPFFDRMEEDLNFKENGRQLKFLGEWKMTLIFLVPEYQSTRVPEYQSARVPEYQSTRVPE